MAALFLGTLGFAAGYAADFCVPGRRARFRACLWALCFALLLSCLALVSIDSSRFSLPGWAVLAGWASLPPVALLLAYSLFIELPLAPVYGSGGAPLITRGTYALVRHPTVLWYLLLLGSLLLLSRSQLLMAAAPLWAGLDLLWAALQERRFLAHAPAEYALYRQRTPFLLPTPRSVRACLTSLRAAPVPRTLQEATHVHRTKTAQRA